MESTNLTNLTRDLSDPMNNLDSQYVNTTVYEVNEIIYSLNDYLPLLYKDERMNNLLESNMMYVIGVESNDNTIKTLRYSNMPVGLVRKCIGVWGKIGEMVKGEKLEKVEYGRKYNRWVYDLDSRYNVLELWEMGVYVGKMGE